MQASPYSYDYIFKYIIIGDMGKHPRMASIGTGKSCLLRRFTDRKFVDGLRNTVGVEFGTRIIRLEDRRIKLQIWDTAGQERFRSVTRSYYRGAAGAILVYDITRRSTFENIANWLMEVKNATAPHTVMFLIGNKSDLEGQREVTQQEAQKFAQLHGLLFAEASARTNTHVDECFLDTAARIYDLVESETIDTGALNSGIQRYASIWRCWKDIDILSAIILLWVNSSEGIAEQ
ncbi:ras family-domain-containing protein [Thamnocephalis sphaerospora]|uniref:Ras family-domain-containing protein n=1 Tax=Thamnocephalis sphaerospora TaxID=78915 RepID=A0A4P9XHX7_9FUNG|nr:ras family-domain-containing protein [Thamnocephalis sphaerospora]|eukprot:RKP05314.1 ras family-domain-containing protein [Thamnocephalis sphaerospora]